MQNLPTAHENELTVILLAHAVDLRARRPRRLETAEERQERLKTEARQKRDEAARNDRAVDEMITRNIELYGP